MYAQARLLILALAACSCGTGPARSSVTDVSLAAPSADKGFQLAVPPFEVAPGTEAQSCYFFTVPGAAGAQIWVNRYQIAQTSGSHHMNIFRVKTIKNLKPTADGSPVVNGECFVSSNWSDWPLVVNSQQQATIDWQLPDDVAARFDAGELLMLQTHYVNATTQKTPGKARVFANFYFPSKPPAHELATLFATNQNIRVCPGETGKSLRQDLQVSLSGRDGARGQRPLPLARLEVRDHACRPSGQRRRRLLRLYRLGRPAHGPRPRHRPARRGRHRVAVHLRRAGGLLRRSLRLLLLHLRRPRRQSGALQCLRLLLPEVGGRELLLSHAVRRGIAGAGRMPSSPARCAAGFVGDRTLPPEARLLMTDGVSREQWEVAPNDPIPLEPPPQGGYVAYVGAAARNLDACGVDLRGTLRDPESGVQLGFDARTSNLIPDGRGWAVSDPSDNSNLSNVNVCPDYAARDQQGRPLILEMEVVDRSHRSARVSVPVVPTCGFDNPLLQRDCLCACSADYFLGKCNPARSDGSSGSD